MASPVEDLFTTAHEVVAMAGPHAMTVRYGVGAIILLFAIWTDLRHRRVPNWVWLLTAGIGLALLLYDVVFGDPGWRWLAAVPVVIVLAYVLWRLRLLFGGADAKCVMAYAILVPYPAALVTAAGVYPHLPAVLPLGVSMLMNAVTFTLALPLAYFVVNLSRGDFHPVAMFLGTRMRLERVFTDPVWVMDWVRPVAPPVTEPTTDPDEAEALTDEDEDEEAYKVDEEGLPIIDPSTVEGASMALKYMPTRAADYALNLARLRALQVEKVWVTPKVPFMIPLFLGFLASFLVGDLVVAFTLWTAGLL